MVRQAREMVAAGELGTIRTIQAEYAQDWLSTDLETTGQNRPTGASTPPALAPAAPSVTSAPRASE